MTTRSSNLERGFRRLAVVAFIFWTGIFPIYWINHTHYTQANVIALFVIWIAVPVVVYGIFLLLRWVYRGFTSPGR